MATNSYTVGPGLFTIGTGPLAVQAQLTSLTVDWTENVATTGEVINLLDDTTVDTTEETATYRASISGNVVQDLAAAGFVAYTWDNKGEEVDFTYQPNTGVTRDITGTCVPVPVTIGGAAKTKPRSDFTFRCIGDPVLADVT
jgi:hypothetical protein